MSAKSAIVSSFGRPWLLLRLLADTLLAACSWSMVMSFGRPSLLPLLLAAECAAAGLSAAMLPSTDDIASSWSIVMSLGRPESLESAESAALWRCCWLLRLAALCAEPDCPACVLGLVCAAVGAALVRVGEE